MFEGWDPQEGRIFSLLDEQGALASPSTGIPLLGDEQALAAWRVMVRARQADEWAVSLNRQGRMPTYVLNKGQEANSVGGLMAVRPDDWFVPAYRELGGMLVRGLSLVQIYRYWYGNEEGSRYPVDELRMTPLAVPVGSQPLHAVGIAWAERYRGTDRIVLTYLGEGATSEGDFHEACNFAGVWKAGVVFFAQNNQWAISLPWEKQSASRTIAEKAFAYGFEGVRVDGNDLFAVYAAVSMAAEKARAGGGPTLIEGLTYRLGAHTTSDDPSRYRDPEVVREWQRRDPLLRLERYLAARGLATTEDAARLRAEAMAEARSAFEQVEQQSDVTVTGDAMQLRQLLQNLLSNAIKFRRPDESPRVHVDARCQGGEWVFSAQDNGVGIPAEQLDRLFLIFQRLHTQDEFPGAGIGLAICKKIAERHGGRIWAESVAGAGSRFQFSVPATTAAPV